MKHRKDYSQETTKAQVIALSVSKLVLEKENKNDALRQKFLPYLVMLFLVTWTSLTVVYNNQLLAQVIICSVIISALFLLKSGDLQERAFKR